MRSSANTTQVKFKSSSGLIIFALVRVITNHYFIISASIKAAKRYAAQVRFFFFFTKRKEEQNKFTTMSIKEQMLVPKKYLNGDLGRFFGLKGFGFTNPTNLFNPPKFPFRQINYSASHTPAASAHYILYFLTLLLFL